MANTNVKKESHFPWTHVIGFALSIALTLLALGVVFYTSLSSQTVIVIIIILAFLQAIVQLFLFMHIRESKDGSLQTSTIIYSALMAIIIVAGTIWVMSFGMHMYH
jgi:cytochrome aa3-600 menaquinol oxidase subunit 4